MAHPVSFLCLIFLTSAVICDESKLFAGSPTYSLKFAFPKDSKGGLELQNLKGVVPRTFTFECWIFVPSKPPVNWPIISHVPGKHWDEPANGYNDYMAYLSGENITFIMGGGADKRNMMVLFEKVATTPGKWGHFAMVIEHHTRDKNEKLDVTLYYDENQYELESVLNPTRQDDPNTPIWLGFMKNQDPETYFFGTVDLPSYMDEIRFWSSARTKKQIDEFAYRTIETPPEDLLLYYTVDESIEREPNSLIDRSRYARHIGLPAGISKDYRNAPIPLSIEVPYDVSFYEIKLIGGSANGPTVPEYVITNTNFSGSAYLSFCPHESCRVNITNSPVLPSNYVYFSSGMPPSEAIPTNVGSIVMSFSYKLVAGKNWRSAVPSESNVATLHIRLKRENQKSCGVCTICGVDWRHLD